MNHAQIIDNLPATQEFACTFIKKDGTTRAGRFRKSAPEGWTPSESGRGLSREQLRERGLILVTDVVLEEWRTIPLAAIKVLETEY